MDRNAVLLGFFVGAAVGGGMMAFIAVSFESWKVRFYASTSLLIAIFCVTAVTFHFTA